MEAKATSPGFWLLIGALVVGAVYFTANPPASSVGSESQAAAHSEATIEPTYSVNVLGVDCEASAGVVSMARVTISNTGAAIPFAKAYVSFRDKSGARLSSGDSYFSPTKVPPGATATATIYGENAKIHSCRLDRIQDGDGNEVVMH